MQRPASNVAGANSLRYIPMKLFDIVLLVPLFLSMVLPSFSQTTENGTLPPLFVENRGQWSGNARFLSRSPGVDFWLTDNALIFDHHVDNKKGRQGHVLRLRFVNSEPGTCVQGIDKALVGLNWIQEGGSVSANGYDRATIRGVYPGVDLVAMNEKGSPRYDFHVAPNADPNSIRIAVDGARGLRIGKQGELIIGTSIGDVTQGRIRAWQTTHGIDQPVACAFHLEQDGTVAFRLGEYDRSRPLIIDPLVYSSYLGGAGNEKAAGVAADGQGNAWVVGSTFSVNFPTLVGGYNTLFSPPEMIFVTRINTTSGGLPVFSTFIGPGTAGGIAVDVNGNSYIAATGASGYPVTQGAYASSGSGTDVYVTKLAPNGTGLVWSARIGGGVATGIALDGTRPVVVGFTGGGYPHTTGAFDTTLDQAGFDAFVTKLSINGSSLAYSTYLGGSGIDQAHGVAVNRIGEVFVAGNTVSRDFPTTAGVLKRVLDSTSDDGFIVRLGRNGDTLVYGTLFGGRGYDIINGIAVNDSNEAYVTGNSSAKNYPTTANAYRPTPYDTNDAFIARVNRTGTALVYSTYIGGAGYDVGNGIAVNGRGEATVVGQTFSNVFSRSPSRYQGTYGGNGDGFITRVTANGNGLIHSTYLGGSALENLVGLALGPGGDVIAAGTTSSTDYPLTSNATQIANAGTTDVVVTRLAILEILHPLGGSSLCAGTLDSISWHGSPEVTYDIWISNNQGRSFNQLAVAVNGSSYPWLIPANIRPDTTYRIRVTTTSGTEADTTDLDITINAKPIVTANPANETEPAGGVGIFTAQATGTPTPSVQWQADSGNGWSNLAGATSRTLRFDFLRTSMNGIRYRAIFSNGCGRDTTSSGLLTVTGISLRSPVGKEIFCSRDTIDVTWEAIGTSGPYMLEYSQTSGSGWTLIDGNVTGTSYRWAIPAGLVGTTFKIRVLLPPGFTYGVNEDDFEIHAAAVVTTEPRDLTIKEKQTIELNSDASGFPVPDVFWEVNDGSGWVAVPNALFRNLRLFDATLAMNGNRYRAIYTTDCGSDTTREALLTVERDSSISGVWSGAGVTGILSLTATPNPARDRVDIHYSTTSPGLIELSMTDLLGHPVIPVRSMTHEGGSGTTTINVGTLPAGIYLCIIRQASGVAVTRIVVE